VAVGALLGDVSMLEDERTLFIHVAAAAGILWSIAFKEMVLAGAMYVMAVDAGKFFFHDRMTGKERELMLRLRMAAIAEIGHVLTGELLPRSLVKFVAVKAADIVEGVRA
jgi:hypothetical protein